MLHFDDSGEEDSEGNNDLRDFDERSFHQDESNEFAKDEENIDSPSPLFAKVNPNTTVHKKNIAIAPFTTE